MPTLGTGIVPSGAIGAQLSAITRRGITQDVIAAVYQASPTFAMLFSKANAASGGISSITVPVQLAPLTTGGFTDFSGAFPAPTVQAGVQPAEFNLKGLVVPVPLLGMQSMLQVDETVVSALELTMNDASSQAISLLTNALFNNTGTNAQQLSGLPQAVSDTGTYGGISRATYPNWGSIAIAEGSTAPTRDSVLLDIIKVIAGQSGGPGGERPTFGVCGPLTWHKLATDFAAQERYNVNPGGSYADGEFGAQAMFQALSVGGVPIYLDANCPEGTIYYLNENYAGLYVHQDASFGFTGFESTLANNQIGFIGALLSLLEFVVSKPSSCGVATGYTHS